MQFILIDYSIDYFTGIKNGRTPRKRKGKFIQILNIDSKTEYFVMSPKELTVFHANIAARFCELNNIAGYYKSGTSDFHIDDPEWTVVGGGMFTVDDNLKLLKFHDSSACYGDFDSNGLEVKIRSTDQFSGYMISIKH